MFLWRKNKKLVEAAAKGHKALVPFLLDNGADVNTRDKDGMTALMYAARGVFASIYPMTITTSAIDHTAIVKILLDSKC